MSKEFNSAVSDENMEQVNGGLNVSNLRFVNGQTVQVSDLTARPGEKPVATQLVTGGSEMPSEKLRQIFLNNSGSQGSTMV